MKKIVAFVGLVGVVVLAWHSTQSSPDPALLRRAMQEFEAHKKQLGNCKYVTAIDYTKSILQPRLFVYDVQARKVVLTTRVSHAWNSGFLYANTFSNQKNSKLSSLGTYITAGAYNGKFGYAMKVEGITPGQNTNASDRFIVFHRDPWYRFSSGCFMTSKDTNQRLINLIKGGSVVYVANN